MHVALPPAVLWPCQTWNLSWETPSFLNMETASSRSTSIKASEAKRGLNCVFCATQDQKRVYTTCLNFQIEILFCYRRARKMTSDLLIFNCFFNFLILAKNSSNFTTIQKINDHLRNRMWLSQMKSVLSTCGPNLLLFLSAFSWKLTF